MLDVDTLLRSLHPAMMNKNKTEKEPKSNSKIVSKNSTYYHKNTEQEWCSLKDNIRETIAASKNWGLLLTIHQQHAAVTM